MKLALLVVLFLLGVIQGVTLGLYWPTCPSTATESSWELAPKMWRL